MKRSTSRSATSSTRRRIGVGSSRCSAGGRDVSGCVTGGIAGHVIGQRPLALLRPAIGASSRSCAPLPSAVPRIECSRPRANAHAYAPGAARYTRCLSTWQELGPHHYRIEDDILHWRPDGEVLVRHAQCVCELFDRIVARHGYALWLVDARRSVALGFESRRHYARWIEQQPRSNLVVAAFGVPVPAQTTASLILRGIQLVQGVQVDHRFFADEAAARAYLDERRSSQGQRTG